MEGETLYQSAFSNDPSGFRRRSAIDAYITGLSLIPAHLRS